jgi:hypothetical protein
LKADGTLAGVVVLEVVSVRLHSGATHRVEGAMLDSRAEGNQWFSVETKSGQPVADALLSLWGCGLTILRSRSSAARLSSLRAAR